MIWLNSTYSVWSQVPEVPKHPNGTICVPRQLVVSALPSLGQSSATPFARHQSQLQLPSGPRIRKDPPLFLLVAVPQRLERQKRDFKNHQRMILLGQEAPNMDAAQSLAGSSRFRNPVTPRKDPLLDSEIDLHPFWRVSAQHTQNCPSQMDVQLFVDVMQLSEKIRTLFGGLRLWSARERRSHGADLDKVRCPRFVNKTDSSLKPNLQHALP